MKTGRRPHGTPLRGRFLDVARVPGKRQDRGAYSLLVERGRIIRATNATTWVIWLVLAVAFLPWLRGANASQCDCIGTTSTVAATDNCCARLDTGCCPDDHPAPAPAPGDCQDHGDDRSPNPDDGCKCPLCPCCAPVLPLVVDADPDLSRAGAGAPGLPAAHAIAPQVAGADLFHPPSA